MNLSKWLRNRQILVPHKQLTIYSKYQWNKVPIKEHWESRDNLTPGGYKMKRMINSQSGWVHWSSHNRRVMVAMSLLQSFWFGTCCWCKNKKTLHIHILVPIAHSFVILFSPKLAYLKNLNFVPHVHSLKSNDPLTLGVSVFGLTVF